MCFFLITQYVTKPKKTSRKATFFNLACNQSEQASSQISLASHEFIYLIIYLKKSLVQKSPQKWKGKKKTRTTWLSGACKTERSCLSGGQTALRRDLVLHFLQPTTQHFQPAQRSAAQRSAVQRPTSCSRSELSSSHFVIFCHLSCEPASKTQGGKKRCEVSATLAIADVWPQTVKEAAQEKQQ